MDNKFVAPGLVSVGIAAKVMGGVVLSGDGELHRPRIVIVTVSGGGFRDFEPAKVGLRVVDKSFLPSGIIGIDTPHCVCAVRKTDDPIIRADLVIVCARVPLIECEPGILGQPTTSDVVQLFPFNAALPRLVVNHRSGTAVGLNRLALFAAGGSVKAMGNAGFPDQKRPRLPGGGVGNGVGLILCGGSRLAAQAAFGGGPLACRLAVGFTLRRFAGDAAAGGTGDGFGNTARIGESNRAVAVHRADDLRAGGQ